MKRTNGTYYSGYAVLAIAAVSVAGIQHLRAQQAGASASQAPLTGYFVTEPWTGGTHTDAAVQALAATTIPMVSYSFASTKDGKTYSGTLVGTSPFAAPKREARFRWWSFRSKSRSARRFSIPVRLTRATVTFRR